MCGLGFRAFGLWGFRVLRFRGFSVGGLGFRLGSFTVLLKHSRDRYLVPGTVQGSGGLL